MLKNEELKEILFDRISWFCQQEHLKVASFKVEAIVNFILDDIEKASIDTGTRRQNKGTGRNR